jgi:RNA polymerase sigma-70 factor (ECF subfamily)
VLILRDVLGFSAREVAVTLHSTEDAVAMTLSRARTSLRDKTHSPLRSPARACTAAEATLVRRLAAAFTAHDVGTVVSLLAADVRIAMPPLAAIWAEFLTEVAFRLVPGGTRRRGTREQAARPRRLHQG